MVTHIADRPSEPTATVMRDEQATSKQEVHIESLGL
jgi:hypothetical protein